MSSETVELFLKRWKVEDEMDAMLDRIVEVVK